MKKAFITSITGQDGSPRKLLDSKKINYLKFNSKVTLKNGLVETYKAYLEA